MNKEIISVVVLSYNSENTILETLDSILNQDYGCQNIELIIGDDASSDRTQDIISSWSNEHDNKFKKIIVNIHEKNKGVVANFKSVCNLATSVWIKPIAADDILMSDCISEFCSYVIKNCNVSCVFCKVQKFNYNEVLDVIPKNDYYFNLPALKQLQHLLIDNFIPAPGSFIKKNLLCDSNLPDIQLSMEDYPLWLKLTSSGIQLKLLNKALVKYRINESLSNSTQRLINKNLNNDVYKCKGKYISDFEKNIFYRFFFHVDIMLLKLLDYICIHLFKNKKNKFSSLIKSKLRKISPIYIFTRIKYIIKSQS